MEKKNPVQASEKLYKAVEECIKALAKTVKTPQLKEAEKEENRIHGCLEELQPTSQKC